MQQMPPCRRCPLLPAPPKGEDASLRLLSYVSLDWMNCVGLLTTVRFATIAGYFPRTQAKLARSLTFSRKLASLSLVGFDSCVSRVRNSRIARAAHRELP